MSGYLIIVGVVSLIALGVVLALIFWIVKLISNQNTIVDSNVVHGSGNRSNTTNTTYTSDDDTFRRQQAAEAPSGEVMHSSHDSHHDSGHDIGVSMGESTASSAMDFSSSSDSFSSSDSGSSSSDSGSSSSSSD